MGVSNPAWFDVFTRVQAETQGVAVTMVHCAFVAVHAFFIIRARISQDGGARRLFRLVLDLFLVFGNLAYRRLRLRLLPLPDEWEPPLRRRNVPR